MWCNFCFMQMSLLSSFFSSEQIEIQYKGPLKNVPSRNAILYHQIQNIKRILRSISVGIYTRTSRNAPLRSSRRQLERSTRQPPSQTWIGESQPPNDGAPAPSDIPVGQPPGGPPDNFFEVPPIIGRPLGPGELGERGPGQGFIAHG
jgi:hypothetical protein